MTYTIPPRYSTHPEVWRHRQELTAAKAGAEGAHTRLAVLERAAADHDAELSRKTAEQPDWPVITGEEAVARGNGSGFVVVYGPRVEPERIAAANEQLNVAIRNMRSAEQALRKAEREHADGYDLLAACREANTPFYCAQPVVTLNSVTYNMGSPVPVAVLEALGPEKTQQLLRIGTLGQLLPRSY